MQRPTNKTSGMLIASGPDEDATNVTANRWTERIVSAGSTCVLVGCVAALSDRANGPISGVLSGEPLTELSLAGVRAQQIAGVVTATIASYSSDHMPLVLFGLGAFALVGLMVRT